MPTRLVVSDDTADDGTWPAKQNILMHIQVISTH